MMASEAIQERIQLRLKEERAKLEDKVLDMLSGCHRTNRDGLRCHVVTHGMFTTTSLASRDMLLVSRFHEFNRVLL